MPRRRHAWRRTVVGVARAERSAATQWAWLSAPTTPGTHHSLHTPHIRAALTRRPGHPAGDFWRGKFEMSGSLTVSNLCCTAFATTRDHAIALPNNRSARSSHPTHTSQTLGAAGASPGQVARQRKRSPREQAVRCSRCCHAQTQQIAAVQLLHAAGPHAAWRVGGQRRSWRDE
jgi:hypothetical protein